MGSQRPRIFSFGRLLLAVGSLFSLPIAVIGGDTSLFSDNSTVPDYVTKYAPLVWLHSQDPFKPSDLLKHVQNTTPLLGSEPLSGVPKLNLDNLATLNEFGDQVFLTSNDDPTTLPPWLFGEAPDPEGQIHNAVPCVVILVEKNAYDVDAFFFYFYSYDRGANITQVVRPLDKLLDNTQGGMHFGDHVGDWEHNMIRFVNGKPTGIWYSQHSDGQALDWDDPALLKFNGRPLVYSAYGSHANYAKVGDHIHDSALIDYCDAGYRWDPTLSAYFYHYDQSSSTIEPLVYPRSSIPTPYPTSFFYYTGKWGDLQYGDDDPRQKTVPHFGLKRFESGPTGPRSKNLVRKGIYPNRRHVKSWMEWGVTIFMFLYPCCIKGWRVWIFGAVVLAILVMIGFGVGYAVIRWKKRRGYKRIESEIPLTDMDAYDYRE